MNKGFWVYYTTGSRSQVQRHFPNYRRAKKFALSLNVVAAIVKAK